MQLNSDNEISPLVEPPKFHLDPPTVDILGMSVLFLIIFANDDKFKLVFMLILFVSLANKSSNIPINSWASAAQGSFPFIGGAFVGVPSRRRALSPEVTDGLPTTSVPEREYHGPGREYREPARVTEAAAARNAAPLLWLRSDTAL